jgi:hypothetical protein
MIPLEPGATGVDSEGRTVTVFAVHPGAPQLIPPDAQVLGGVLAGCVEHVAYTRDGAICVTNIALWPYIGERAGKEKK